MALVTRQSVPPGLAPAQYREALRTDFAWACAYCSIAELEATGISFEIDHYIPSAGGGSDRYDNLYYSCDRCNGSKSGWMSDAKAIGGLYIIRIDLENPTDHIIGDHTDVGKVAAIDSTGEYNIARLDLNRRALQRVRQQRARLQGANHVIQHGLRVLQQLRLDQFPQKIRWDIERRRKELSNASDNLRRAVVEHIETECRADLLDLDPNKVDRDRLRERYLGQLPPALVTFAKRSK